MMVARLSCCRILFPQVDAKGKADGYSNVRRIRRRAELEAKIDRLAGAEPIRHSKCETAYLCAVGSFDTAADFL